MNYRHKKTLAVILIFLLFISQPAFAEAKGNAWPFKGDICLSHDSAASEYDGGGVRIALIDTGVSCKYIDKSHVSEGKNYVFSDMPADDLVGHGTALAGIILGSEKLGLKGIAAGAEIIPFVYYSRYISGVGSLTAELMQFVMLFMMQSIHMIAGSLISVREC